MIRARVQLFLMGCLISGALPPVSTAQQFNQLPVMLKSMGSAVNSSADDYAPALLDDGTTLFFTSSRKQDSRGGADLFLTRRIERTWFEAVNAGEGTNTMGDDGTMSFTADGKRVVFARDSGPGHVGQTDLYIARMLNGRPSDVRNLGNAINTRWWESHPAISPDGSFLIFASNAPGGYGGLDLWISRSDSNGVWGRAFPLGAIINTDRNECSPFIAADGATLYFASDGWYGNGGFDMWMSRLVDGDWTPPVNLGPTINSTADDVFLAAPSTSGVWYLSSSRQGGSGGLDIYQGTPDVFGAGVSCVSVRINTSNASDSVFALVRARDVETGAILDQALVFPASPECSFCLPSRRSVSLDLLTASGNRQSVSIRPADAAGAPVSITVPERQEPRVRRSVPLFVAGYHRPFTRQGLDRLLQDRDVSLRRSACVYRPRRDERSMSMLSARAAAVEGMLRRLYTALVDDIFAESLTFADRGAYLDIDVTGYPDPVPCTSAYPESSPVSFITSTGAYRTRAPGDTLDAEDLAGVRAFYTGELLDRVFLSGADRGKAHYSQMKAEDRIRWTYRAAPLTDLEHDASARRGFRLIIRRHVPGSGEHAVLYDSHSALGTW